MGLKVESFSRAFAFVASLQRPDLGVARVVAGLLVIGAAAMLWRHVQRTNMELARFIDAVKFGDFSQSFSHRADGSGFSELGSVLDAALKRMRDEKHKLIDANRFYEAVLDDAPTALLTVDNGKVELANKVFTPSEAEVTKAKRIVEAMQQAAKEGKGAVSLDGRLIDIASIRQAEALLNKAKQCGMA